MCLKGQSNEIFNLQFFFIIRTDCTEPTYLQYLPSYLLYQRVSLFSIFIKISKSFSNFKFKARRGLRPREIDLPELLLSVWCPGELFSLRGLMPTLPREVILSPGSDARGVILSPGSDALGSHSFSGVWCPWESIFAGFSTPRSQLQFL